MQITSTNSKQQPLTWSLSLLGCRVLLIPSAATASCEEFCPRRQSIMGLDKVLNPSFPASFNFLSSHLLPFPSSEWVSLLCLTDKVTTSLHYLKFQTSCIPTLKIINISHQRRKEYLKIYTTVKVDGKAIKLSTRKN